MNPLNELLPMTRAASPTVPPAPISLAQRQTLRRRLANLRATAARRGTTLDEWDEHRESRAGEQHFELGAWCWWSTQRADLTIENRVAVIFAMLASGLTSIGYEFFTAFEFGEREFDRFFEMCDGAELVQAVSDRVLTSGHAVAIEGLRANGWERPLRQGSLFGHA